jgi:hypothetical protein
VTGRRAQIAMAPDELAGFLRARRVLTCATIGRDGWPHLTARSIAQRALAGSVATWDHRKLAGGY